MSDAHRVHVSAGELSSHDDYKFPPPDETVLTAIRSGNVELACQTRATQIDEARGPDLQLGNVRENVPDGVQVATADQYPLLPVFDPKHEEYAGYRDAAVARVQDRKANDPTFDFEEFDYRIERIPVSASELDEAGETMEIHQGRARTAANSVGYVRIQPIGGPDNQTLFSAVTPDADCVFGIGGETAVRRHFDANHYVEVAPSELSSPDPWQWFQNEAWMHGIESPEQFVVAAIGSAATRELLAGGSSGTTTA